ncbi:aliphatic sulfonate ABC transporter substrate-binding protein [Georgenia sp. SYP-B2076]|uniref:aliphatic sulfonate ABC transporter substrate-binding protein n=1 Tax=Georgenia sp. SYP-B2076 TaxID=2495881 RepID=UPI000F8CA6F7|nr:aliphatic sulfonate ABC transporter substrate-binding protein [Georgenia sp. SYP-B2076]
MKRPARTAALLTAAALALSGCVPGEGTASAKDAATGGGELSIDFATYNPLSLVIKEKGWLEDALADDGVSVTWIQSAGSNKANELLRSGELDVGSTAGSAALLARSNGSPIRTIDIYSQPEWAALVTTPDSGITAVGDLVGRQVAATKGTDPYFFLLQALAEAGVDAGDVTIQNLQHADGRAALDSGSVDAWAGLDPIMAAAEQGGDVLFYRNIDFNTYGFLNATEEFLTEQPEVAQTVVDAYEHARAWAQENPEETVTILAEAAGIDPSVAAAVIERTNLDVDPAPGKAQLDVLTTVGPMFVETGDVESQAKIDDALAALLDDSFVSKADPATIGAS